MSTRSTASWLSLLALFYMAPASAGVNEFTLTGNEGGYIWAIAAQPGNGNLVLAASARGIHRSTNGGTSWTLTAPDMLGLTTHVEFDPTTPARVFVLNRQVYLSEDAGQSFAATTANSTGFDYLAVGGNRVYVGSLNGTIYRSDDHALTWVPLTVPWASPTARMHTMAADPSNGGVLYACVEGAGTYKTTDYGATWINPPTAPAISPCGGPYNWTHNISVSPADPNRIIAPTADGIFLSTNGGTSWTQVTTTPFLEFVEFDPHAPNNVFSVDITGRVTRSSDGGATWPFSPTDLYLKVDRVEAASFGNAAGQIYIASPNGPMYSNDNGNTFTLRVTGIHASDVSEVLAADDGTIYAAQSHGQAGLFRRSAGTWLPLDNVELQSLLLNPLGFIDVALSPENSSILYAAAMADGLFRSNNGGADWIGPPPSLQMQVFDIAVDPTNPLRAYASKAVGGMMRTTNGGQTYTACGLSNSVSMRNVVVARASPNILYGIGNYGPVNQIYKSTDFCASWTQVGSQLQYYFNHVDIDPVDAQDIWLAHYTGVQRSRDGGATWETVQFNFEHDDIVLGFRVLFDPALTSTVWVLNNNHAGFARSVDDGATWQKVLFPYTGNASYLRNGVLDPLSPDTLVAGASEYGLVEYQAAPDLAVTLDAPAALIPTGTSAVATLNLRNNGPLDASAADITVALPAFLSVPALPSGCTSSPGAVRCHVAPIHVNQTSAIPLTLVAAAAPGTGNLSVSVAGHEADPVSSNNTAAAAVQTARRADLAVTAPAGPTIGRTTSTSLDFTLANQGPDIAENARVTFTLPAGLQATAATSPAGPCTVTASLVNCTLGTLAANASTTAQLRVQGMTSGTHSVSTQLGSDGLDTDQDQTAATAVVVQAYADLSMEITVPAGTRTAGTSFTYTATIRNAGPDTAAPRANFTVAGATIDSVTITQGANCVVSGGNVICQPGDIASGASVSASLTVTPASAGTVTAEGAATFGGTDPTSTNDRVTLTTTVVAAPPPSGGGSSSGSGGGGGSLDWLALALLAGALARKMGSGPVS